MPEARLARPTAREIASGVVLGLETASYATPAVPSRTPLAALEAAVLPSLVRAPCLVSFSGGLDSSLVLAVATRVARREGLPLPVPVSWRFTGAPRAEESTAQTAVVRALELPDWSLLRAEDDLDLIGPVAQRILLSLGVVHPVNLHLHLPLVEQATCGSVLTGIGGDQVLAGWRGTWRVGPWRGRARRLARSMRRGLHPAGGERFEWLWPEVAAAVRRELAVERRVEPRRLDLRMAWHTSRRDLLLGVDALHELADDAGAAVAHPLLDAGFCAALAARCGQTRNATRSRLLAMIADGQLPTAVTAPRPKARLGEVFLRGPTREFVSTWDGSGVDTALVDPGALRRAWSQWPIPGATAALVQQSWLATIGAMAPLPVPHAYSEVPS